MSRHIDPNDLARYRPATITAVSSRPLPLSYAELLEMIALDQGLACPWPRRRYENPLLDTVPDPRLVALNKEINGRIKREWPIIRARRFVEKYGHWTKKP